MCLDSCRDGEYKEFKEDNGDGTSTYYCKKKCDKYIYQKDTNSELECVSFCPDDKHFIGENDICKNSMNN